MERTRVNDINFFTTYRCNSRCKNCLIWKGRLLPPSREKQMDATDLKKLFSDPLFVNCSDIGLAGGEPTISPFFWKLMDFLPDDKHVTITTNALSSERLLDFFSRSREKARYMVQLSLDGIGDKHDRMRGVKGAYQKTLDLLKELETIGISRLISFTINRLNYHQLKDCYELARDHGAEFSTRMAYAGGAYSNRENREVFRFDRDELDRLSQDLNDIVVRELRRPSHSPSRIVFLNKITDYYRGVQEDIPCMALESGMVIDLYGNVFPNCPAMMTPIGNLHEACLEEIWASEKARKVRDRIKKLKCGGCWNDCQMITNIEFDREFLDNEYSRLKIAYLEGKPVPYLIDFNQGEFSLLLSGWYDIEGDSDFKFRWTEQEFSILLPGGTTSLEMFAMSPPDSKPDSPYTMDVVMGQEKMGTIVFTGSDWKKYSVSLLRRTKSLALCRFKLNGCYCPKEVGKSEDMRKLGLAIHGISFA
jgi:MoaA/NifB/PqqE/SkfB family radical SAM enzyme